MAFIMKLCWSLLTRKDALWVRCFWSKYNCGNSLIPKVASKRNSSSAWKAIVEVWGKFLNGIGRKVNNGATTKFWVDLWLPLDRPLVTFTMDPTLINIDETVQEQLSIHGNWDSNRWRGVLPPHIINIISKVQPPRANLSDCFMWRPAKDGCFSVKSAYIYLSDQGSASRNNFWSMMWKWQLPEKVKFFMWQVSHERLATNSLRTKRGLANDALCPFQCSSEESVIHIIRDCQPAKNLWREIIKTNYLSEFFAGNLQVWLNWNSNHSPAKGRLQKHSWPRVFSLACWILWTSRCTFLFQGEAKDTREMLHLCNHLLMESSHNHILSHQIFQIDRHEERSWTPPPADVARIDVDGSVRHQFEAACGGVIRNSEGQWLMGFCKSLGVRSVVEAELIAILLGLKLAYQMGLQKILLYSDSLDAVNILTRDSCGEDHPLRGTIRDIRDLLLRDWDVKIHHTSRDNITCADYMAKEGHNASVDDDIVLFPTIHRGCLHMALRDQQACSP